ncbi:carbon storage regulator [Tuwongella immobilis]|uniref:Translational regulator CsrA n=1 Tax=Tuwongella immobilis TaxID=692036 RepID=A0A6C2YJD9_9BACT|nr:carbon storage regulator [Tuwongella immobilis]VIP01359.1 carbon storage regulator : Carbon storage regulator homolog OS=Planctomyces brasiliensis (strain ATCC 49424 / DSM 5305 / JCM 21570 / NBRC 103401 / IFAM 1448) GN=csrA PE=3 SV=1: CsrA [Tuwongella immobilis]VTR98170.1 carbon storage regulator : Carbon storage regulator homolog OS=Planctomyces brasiliensis (strain ATCC 49424 / DSM 5305 / JCM 21570 / NBRC 103401 / IFAM 1448) GN=csrA PE=3 SV=1: CsrA [Tuwongella immobilis]
MLVLTRKTNESIVIPSLGITITISDIRSDRVRIGIDAPHDIKIHRSEIWDKEKERRTAALDAETVDELKLPVLTEEVAKRA